ncbi:sensor histidine kinase [Arcticibacterium luteifluviistationis]|uniref:sensor histidine kinase n=1 Tax=Arcticibacterium luteifluviistationis TaxID=1784714 RepID=UPI0013A6E4AB|nr:7TM-DISM domain-containing protein [Arcticibacterium luteifluviistationis]
MIQLKILLLFCLAFCGSKTFSKPIPLVASEIGKQHALENYQTFTDSTKQLSIQEIRKRFEDGDFTPVKRYNYSQAIGDFNYWTHLSLQNNTQEELELVLECATINIDSFTVFLYQKDSLISQVGLKGKNDNIYSRKNYFIQNALPIILTQSQENYDVLILTNKKRGLMYSKFLLYNLEDYTRKENYTHSKMLFLLGIGCIAIFIGLLIFIYKRNVLYIYFILSLIFKLYSLICNFSFESYLNIYTPTNFSWGTSNLLYFIFQFLFYDKLIAINKFKKSTYCLVAILLIISTTHIFNIQSANIYRLFNIVSLLVAIIFFFIIFKNLNRKDIFTWVYLLAVAPYFISFLLMIAFIFFNKDLYNSLSVNSSNLYYLIILYEIIVFLFLIIYKQYYIYLDSIKLRKSLNIAQVKIISSQEKERKNIAENLHDDLGGTLSTLKGKAHEENISPDIKLLIEKSIKDLRNVSRNLLPPDFEKQGLIDSIKDNLDLLSSNTTTKFIFITFGKEVKMTPERSINIYRIINEIANNILKHSNVKLATIQLIYYPEKLLIITEDEQLVKNNLNQNNGIGLSNILSRLEYLEANIIQFATINSYNYIFEIPYDTKQGF